MPVNTTKKVWATGYNNSAFRSLYNGNIASMQVNIPKLGSAFLYQYTYDQLNRIVGMQADTTLNTSTNTWSPLELKDYKERVSYDANGNILNYMRRGKVTAGTNPSGLMDSLNYKYYYTNTSGNRKWYDPGQGIPSDALSLTNKLAHVDDNTGYDSYFTEDIDDQDTANYAYDEIGNLIKDTKEGITGIEWTVYGKIKKITKTGGTTTEYRYDASGNRIWKKAASIETWYVRDASGNVMSIYTYNNSSINSGALSQTETDLYGSSRLGMLKPNINVQSSLAGPAIGTKYITTFTRGNKIFELSNHLGNVLVTVSDKKIPVAKATPNQAQVSYYTADVLSATDYYPFGMSMPRRDTTFSESYRYKFNGKELDKDIQGADYDYGFRIYDPRTGKFLSVDPLTKTYPFYTPYQFASNTPICSIDLDGMESKFVLSAINYEPQLSLSKKEIVLLHLFHQQCLVSHIYDEIKNKVKVSVNSSSLAKLWQVNFVSMRIDEIIEADVATYLNFSETVNYKDKNISSLDKYAYSTSADFNYNKLGKGVELKLADIWEQSETERDIYKESKEITGFKDPLDILNEKIKKQVLKQIEIKFTELGEKQFYKILAKGAEKIGKYGSVFLDIAEQLQGELSSSTGSKDFVKDYLKLVEITTVTELLKYYIQDGSALPKGINIRQYEHQEKIDKTQVTKSKVHES